MKRYLLLILTIAILLSGCSNQVNNKLDEKETIKVVTSFYPIYLFALNVAGDTKGIKITNMTQPQTGCLHDYQLTTKDMKELNDTNMLLINGAGMEGFLKDVIEQFPTLKVVDTSEGVQLEENSDSGHTHNHEENNLEPEELFFNSHIWLSVDNAMIQIENICEAFCQADPVNASHYKANAQNYIEKLKQLSNDIKAVKKDNVKKAISFHEGFDYIAKEFELEIEFGIYSDENEEPTARELAKAIAEVKEENIPFLLTADDKGRKTAELIAAETNARVVILNPVTGGASSTEEYINAMEYNLETLKKAFQEENLHGERN